MLRRVSIAAEAEGPVVVGELDAEGARGVQVTDRVGAGQQVPGHVPQPGGGVDQVGGPTERGDLCEDPVDGGLQGDLQVAEISCRGEGPGVLESQYLRIVPVEAGVLEGLSGLVGRLGTGSAVATRWSTSAAVCRAATSMASWSTTVFSA